VLLLWAVSPVIAFRTGLPRKDRATTLDDRERTVLRRTARLTWRFFEEMLTESDNWLIPDNHQDGRPDPIAHRTSPTNIGLQLLATLSARDLGYISTSTCLQLLERAFQSIQKLPRYRGHFFNWYDTQTLAALAPLYVSTVDSGNLLGYLLTLKMALPPLVVEREIVDERLQEALKDTLDLFERDGAGVMAALGRDSVRGFRADVRRAQAAIAETLPPSDRWAEWLQNVSNQIATLAARLHDAQDRSATMTAQLASSAFWLEAASSLVTERRRELGMSAAARQQAADALDARAARLIALCDKLVGSTEMEFLFDSQRHLFAIGYNVTEGRRDNTFYDALASEARLASFVAIATRHVVQDHWFYLGWLLTAVGHRREIL
jgi:hypothetical protein